MTTTRNIYTGRYPDLRSPIWPQWFSRWMCRRHGHGALKMFDGEYYCRMCGMDARNITDESSMNSGSGK